MLVLITNRKSRTYV